jgi:tryptophan 2,3-dioxygenase
MVEGMTVDGDAPEAQPHGLTYSSYLHVPELLTLQHTLADPPAHDELLFICVHQAYELWFKLVLAELEAVRDSLLAGSPGPARHLLRRVLVVVDLAVQQWAVLESMSFADFHAFRDAFGNASGFQSVQFREIERLSGLEITLKRLPGEPEEQQRLRQRLSEPTVWDGFCALLASEGLPMPADDREARRASLVRMTEERGLHPDSFAVAEDLMAYDEAFLMWRTRHVVTVERQIGDQPGTGGSSGADYLRKTLSLRFYPELWELRTTAWERHVQQRERRG